MSKQNCDVVAHDLAHWLSHQKSNLKQLSREQQLRLAPILRLQVRAKKKEIAEIHFNLTKKGGYLVYETQKLSGRPDNKKHVARMVREFRKLYHSEIEVSAARKAGERMYFIFRKTS